MTPPGPVKPTRAERRAQRASCPRRRKRRRRTRQVGYGLLALVLGALGLIAVVTQTGVATRLIVPKLSALTSTPVEARRARIGLDGSIVLEDASFLVPGLEPRQAAEFFRVDKAVVWMDWGSLASGVPVVRNVELYAPTFRLSQSKETGRLNVAGLSFLTADAGLGGFSETFHLPVLATHGGVIEIGEHDADTYTVLKRLPVDGDLVPTAQPGGQAVAFRLRQTQEGSGRPAIDLRGRYGKNGLEITLDEFELDAWSSDVVPTKVRALYERLALEGAIGETTLRVDQRGKLSAAMQLEGVGVSIPFDVSGELIESGRTLRLERTTGVVELSAEGLKADLTGELNELSYQVTLTSDGVEKTSPFVCTLRTDARLERGMDLLIFAPEAVLHPIEMFEDPRADVDATVRIERGPARPDGTPDGVRVTGDLRISNGSAAYRNFPYRFDELEGQVSFDERSVRIDWVRGRNANGATLRAEGTFGPVGPEAEVSLRVWAEGVPIDDELRAAMSPARQRMVDALFNEQRYGELVDEGLVAPPGAGERRAALLGETGAALAALDGSEPRGERRRLERRAAALRDALRAEPDFAFGGRADVVVDIHRELGEVSVWTRTIDVTLERAGMVPEHFPLPIVADGARLLIDEREARVVGGVFRGASGGEATIAASVALADEAGDPILDPVPTIDIHAEGVPIDERLLAAIPGYRSSDPGEAGTLRDMLDRLRLSGTASCEAALGPDADGRLGYDIRARVSGLSSRPVPLGDDPVLAAIGEAPVSELRLDGVDGEIRVDRSRIGLDLSGAMSIEGETGADPAAVALRAELDFIDAGTGFTRLAGVESGERGPPRPGPALELSVVAEGLDLETPIEHAAAVFSRSMGERVASWRGRYHPEGVMDASVALRGFVGGALEATVEGSRARRLAWGEGAERVEIGETSGRVVVTTGPSARVRADGLSAPVRYGGEGAGVVRADGWLPLVPAGETPVFDAGAGLRVRVDGARFESSLTRRLASGRVSEGVRSFLLDRHAEGEYGVEVRATPKREPAPGEAGEAGELALPALAFDGWILPRSLALDTEAGRVSAGSMTGRVRFEPGGGVIEQVSADAGDWRARADGRWATPGPGEVNASLELDLVSTSGLSEQVLALLPGPVSGVLGSLGVRAEGGVVARDVLVGYQKVAGVDHPIIDASGVVAFEGAAAEVGVDLTEATGELTFSATTTRERAEPAFRVDVAAERVRAGGVRLTDARAQVMSGREPGEVLAPTIEAACHGGRVAASARVREEDDGRRYWAEVVASGVRAAPVFGDLGVETTDPEAGSMTEMGEPDPRAAETRRWDGADDRSRGVLEANVSLSGLAGSAGDRSGRGTMQITGGRVVALPGLIHLIEFSNLQLPVGDTLDTAQASFFVEGPTVTFEQLSALSSSVEIFGFGTMRWSTRELDLKFNSRAVRPIPIVSEVLSGLRDELITTRVRGTPGALELSTEQLTGTRRMLRSLFGGEPTPEERRMEEIEDRARTGQARVLRSAERAAERAAMPATPGTVYPDETPGEAPTVVVHPTDDE